MVSFDLLDESLMHSYFGRVATPVMSTTVQLILYLYIMAITCSVEPQCFRNGFVTIFRLLHLSYFACTLDKSLQTGN